MKFTVVVLQYDGSVTDCHEMDLASLRGNVLARQVTARFEAGLHEHLEADRTSPFEFQQSLFADHTDLLKWRQSNLFCATAAISCSGTLKFTWFYFSGIDAAADAIAVRIMCETLTQMTASTGVSAADSLRSLTQRPLAVCIPWPPSASEMERDRTGKIAILLGATYFAEGIELRERIGTRWENYLNHWRGEAAKWSEN